MLKCEIRNEAGIEAQACAAPANPLRLRLKNRSLAFPLATATLPERTTGQKIYGSAQSAGSNDAGHVDTLFAEQHSAEKLMGGCARIQHPAVLVVVGQFMISKLYCKVREFYDAIGHFEGFIRECRTVS